MADDVFKALADRTRRKILDELTQQNGQTLFEICGRLATKHNLASSRQAISQHLAVLESAGLVRTRRQGRYKFHDLTPEPLERIAARWLTADLRRPKMRIHLSSVFVDDQDKALHFYTEILGFVKKHEVPVGEYRWLTVVSPDDPNGTELLLETDDHPAVKPYKEALVSDGIPAAAFAVNDGQAEYDRLRELGVDFTQKPTAMGPVMTAVLDDTCGNLIQLAQQDA